MAKDRAGRHGESGLVQAGEIPLIKNLAKKFAPPTKAQLEFVHSELAARTNSASSQS